VNLVAMSVVVAAAKVMINVVVAVARFHQVHAPVVVGGVEHAVKVVAVPIAKAVVAILAALAAGGRASASGLWVTLSAVAVFLLEIVGHLLEAGVRSFASH
jgi:hypothetical protein